MDKTGRLWTIPIRMWWSLVLPLPGDAPANGYDDLKRPAYTAPGHRFFSRRLSNPLLARKNDIAPSSSGNLQRPSVTHGSAA